MTSNNNDDEININNNRTLITLNDILFFAARSLQLPSANNNHQNNLLETVIIDQFLTNRKEAPHQIFSKVLFRVFPSLSKNYGLPSLSSSSSSSLTTKDSSTTTITITMMSLATIQTLTHTILGIPPRLINLEEISKRNVMNILSGLAVLFFFAAVSKDHSFQAEFSLPTQRQIQKMLIAKDGEESNSDDDDNDEKQKLEEQEDYEPILDESICDFLQSKECIPILLRGGSVSLFAEEDHNNKDDDTHYEAKEVSTQQPPPNRQLEFSSGGTPSQLPLQRQQQQQHTDSSSSISSQSSILSSCDTLTTILDSYADMVDAALGNDKELSDGSKHRIALQVGKTQVELIRKEVAVMIKMMSHQKNSSSSSTAATTTPSSNHHNQYYENNNTTPSSSSSPGGVGGMMSEELQGMIVRVIRERNEAREEADQLREMVADQSNKTKKEE